MPSSPPGDLLAQSVPVSWDMLNCSALPPFAALGRSIAIARGLHSPLLEAASPAQACARRALAALERPCGDAKPPPVYFLEVSWRSAALLTKRALSRSSDQPPPAFPAPRPPAPPLGGPESSCSCVNYNLDWSQA